MRNWLCGIWIEENNARLTFENSAPSVPKQPKAPEYSITIIFSKHKISQIPAYKYIKYPECLTINKTERQRQRERNPKRQRDEETKRQRDRETKRQRDKETEIQRNRLTKSQRDKETD